MSGNSAGQIGALNLLPSTENTNPSEGSKVACIVISWQTTTPFGTCNINLLQQTQSGQFSSPQSVFIDNSTVPFSVSITCSQTGHKILVEPFSQGMFRLLSSQSPSYVVSLLYIEDFQTGTIIQLCTTKLFFLNTPQGPYTTTNPLYGNNFANSQQTFNDISPGVAFSLAPVPSLNTHYIINSLTASFQFDDAAGTENAYTLVIYEQVNSTPFCVRLLASGIATVTPNNFATCLFQQYVFQTPIMLQTPQSNFCLEIFGASGATFPVANVLNIQCNYGTVLIQ